MKYKRYIAIIAFIEFSLTYSTHDRFWITNFERIVEKISFY